MISTPNPKTYPGAVALLKKRTLLRFGQGKVELFSDFDGTYFPARQRDFRDPDKRNREVQRLKPYFESFSEFLNKTRDAVTFKITTGRNRGEFESFVNQIRAWGLRLPLPQSLITDNGGDEFYKAVQDEEYYSNGPFPYTWKSVNQAKRDTIRDEDGSKIRNGILKGFQAACLPVRQDPTTNSANDYGAASSLYHIPHDTFNPNEHKHNIQQAPYSPWVGVLRQDGDLGFLLGLPKDMLYRPDRRDAYTRLRRETVSALSDTVKRTSANQYFYHVKERDKDRQYADHPTISIRPSFYKDSSDTDGTPLDKTFDVRKAIEQAKENNDLVIVAGDSSNDTSMLNSASYLHIPEELKRDNPFIHSQITNPETLKKSIAKNKTLAEEYGKLPFIGIFVDGDGNNGGLRQLNSQFGNENNPNPKIIKVNSGNLQQGVEQAIRLYSKQNPAFAEKMHPQLIDSLKIEQPKKKQKIISSNSS